jgi:hypothetical protein
MKWLEIEKTQKKSKFACLWLQDFPACSRPACLPVCISHFNGKWAGPPAENRTSFVFGGQAGLPAGMHFTL